MVSASARGPAAPSPPLARDLASAPRPPPCRLPGGGGSSLHGAARGAPSGRVKEGSVESYGGVTPVSLNGGRLAQGRVRSHVERRVLLARGALYLAWPDCGGELRAEDSRISGSRHAPHLLAKAVTTGWPSGRAPRAARQCEAARLREMSLGPTVRWEKDEAVKDTAVTRKVAHILEDGSDSKPLCAWLEALLRARRPLPNETGISKPRGSAGQGASTTRRSAHHLNPCLARRPQLNETGVIPPVFSTHQGINNPRGAKLPSAVRRP